MENKYISDKGIKSTVYLLDCIMGMKQYSDNYFDLSVIDPPYGIGANQMTLGNGKKKIYRGENDWDNAILLPDRKSTRLNSSHPSRSRMPSSA